MTTPWWIVLVLLAWCEFECVKSAWVFEEGLHDQAAQLAAKAYTSQQCAAADSHM